jgi:hypothetical protein
MMLKPVVILSALLAGTVLAQAQEGKFSQGSEAKEFGLWEEEKALFSGKVVDVACELTGDCPDNCGDGNRIMGIVRDADDVLVLVLKNAQFSFNGPVEDLLPFCQKQVDVDGLLIGDEETYGVKYYMVQKIRDKGAPEWQAANKWTAAWNARNPEAAAEKGPWFRKDPRVRKQIEATGYFGLGAEADQQYREENQ